MYLCTATEIIDMGEIKIWWIFEVASPWKLLIPFSNITGPNKFKFGGLALDSSGNATIDGVPVGEEAWYSIGAKVPFPAPGMFHGVMGHGEFDVGYVSLVNLYTLRQFPTPDIGK